ncbi:MAG TPA: hypothetical protein VFV52_15715 [Bacilli bacterium]|nr:hypothetical protein [Bacilli bacterium]
MQLPPEELEQRYTRLRAVVAGFEIRYNQLPDQVKDRFDEADLTAIADLMAEKRDLERLIPELKDFLRKWEEDGGQSVL